MLIPSFIYYIGGAIFIKFHSSATNENTTFLENGAKNYGGAINAEDSSTVRSNECLFHRNFAYNGPCVATYKSCSLYQWRSRFIQNGRVNGGTDGVMKMTGGVEFETIDCLFSKNIGRWGGVFWITSTRKVLIQGSAFEGNSANGGAAIYMSRGLTIHIDGSEFVNNRGQKEGGALYSNSNDVKLSIKGCLFKVRNIF